MHDHPVPQPGHRKPGVRGGVQRLNVCLALHPPSLGLQIESGNIFYCNFLELIPEVVGHCCIGSLHIRHSSEIFFADNL